MWGTRGPATAVGQQGDRRSTCGAALFPAGSSCFWRSDPGSSIPRTLVGQPSHGPLQSRNPEGGTSVGTRTLKDTSCCLFGRLVSCDTCLEHPSVSRYHTVLQHRGSGPSGDSDGHEQGFYLYDLESIHRTFLNKTRILSRTYYRVHVHVGHVIRFGGSTRLFILQGPEEDRETESELTVTQFKELRKQQQMLLGEDSDEEEEANTTEGKRNTSIKMMRWAARGEWEKML